MLLDNELLTVSFATCCCHAEAAKRASVRRQLDIRVDDGRGCFGFKKKLVACIGTAHSCYFEAYHWLAESCSIKIVRLEEQE